MGQVVPFINGTWDTDNDGDPWTYHAAYDGADLGTVQCRGPEDIDAAVAAAHAAQPGWARTSVLERVDLLNTATELLKEKNEAIATEISREMGKTIHESREEMVDYAWGHFRRAAEDVLRHRGHVLVNAETRENHKRVFATHAPLGVIGVISPFNFPVDIAAIALTYAVASGNTVVWKPSEFTPGSCALYTQIFEDAGFPPGVFNFVPGKADAGAALVDHRDVNGIFFTGSTKVGKSIAERSGLKRLLLELGGNGPLIVHHDADLDRAVEAAHTGCFYMAGQVCTAAERILVHEDVQDDFVERLSKRMSEIRVGDPLDEATEMGPLCNDMVAQQVQAHIDDAVAQGATMLQNFEPDGRMYPPTLLTGVTPSMLVAQEETFGPVAPIISYATVDEAIAIANGTPYGLNMAAFTTNFATAWKFVDELQAGTVCVNETTNYWDQLAPFGGVKESGMGRELSSWVLDAFSEVKTVVMDVAP